MGNAFLFKVLATPSEWLLEKERLYSLSYLLYILKVLGWNLGTPLYIKL